MRSEHERVTLFVSSDSSHLRSQRFYKYWLHYGLWPIESFEHVYWLLHNIKQWRIQDSGLGDTATFLCKKPEREPPPKKKEEEPSCQSLRTFTHSFWAYYLLISFSIIHKIKNENLSKLHYLRSVLTRRATTSFAQFITRCTRACATSRSAGVWRHSRVESNTRRPLCTSAAFTSTSTSTHVLVTWTTPRLVRFSWFPY